MALPTKTKTWQFLWNNLTGSTGAIATDASSLFYNLSVKLLALRNAVDGSGNPSGGTAIFTCQGSSNGTTAGMDAVNRWSSASQVNFTNNAYNSWIVLRNGGSGLTNPYYLLVVPYLATGIYYGYFAISYSGFTGGSTTALPTATDLFVLAGNNVAAANTLTTQGVCVQPTTAYIGKLHVIASIDGTSVRWAHSSNGITQMMYCVEQPTQTPSAWANPLVVFNNGSVAYSASWTANCATTAALFTTSNCVSIRGNPNPLAASPLLPQPVVGFLTTEYYNGATLAGTETLPNDLDGTWPLCNIGVASFSTIGYRGRLGIMADMWQGATNAGDLTTYPTDATRQLVQFQNLVWPNNGTIVQAS